MPPMFVPYPANLRRSTTSKMTLIVTTFQRNPETGEYLGDPYPEEPGADLAGTEIWRYEVWGSYAAIRRGAKFLPQLTENDLYIENEDLDGFRKECNMFLEDIEGFANEIQAVPETIVHRLNNFIKAIERANREYGGVHIG